MTILSDRPWPTAYLSVSATNVVLPKLLSQSFNLLTPEKRDTRLDITVLFLACLLTLALFALATFSSAKQSLILSHPPLLHLPSCFYSLP